MHEGRHTVGKSPQAAGACAAHGHVQLMRNPVCATRSGDRLPVVIGDIPDETLFRLDMPIDAAACLCDTGLALRAVIFSEDCTDRITPRVLKTFRHNVRPCNSLQCTTYIVQLMLYCCASFRSTHIHKEACVIETDRRIWN